MKSDKPPLGPKRSLNTINTTIDASESYNDFGQAIPVKSSPSTIVDGIPNKLLSKLYEAKCKDLKIHSNSE